MKRASLLVLALAALSVSARAQANQNNFNGSGNGVGVYTVATLPAAPATGTVAVVKDGSSGTDCTVGSGSTYVLCRFVTGTGWGTFSGGSAAAGGSTTQLQYNNANALAGIAQWTTNGTTTLTGGATSVLNFTAGAHLDLSGLTSISASLYLLPTCSGGTAGANFQVCFDAANHVYHGYVQAADEVFMSMALTDITGDINTNHVLSPGGTAGIFTPKALTTAMLPAVTVLNNQANTYSGGGLQDFNAMDLRLPNHASDPATCSVGQIEFNTVGVATKICTATNTWTALGAGGGTTTNALTMNNSNAGAASSSTFNGSAAVTISANSVGAPSLSAANTYSGGGLQDFNAMDLLQPVHAADPGTCSVGQIEFNSTGAAMKVCTATNTWTALAAGGTISGQVTGQFPLPGSASSITNTLAAGTNQGTYYVGRQNTSQGTAASPSELQVGDCSAPTTVSGAGTTATVAFTDAVGCTVRHDIAGSAGATITIPTPTTLNNAHPFFTYENDSNQSDTLSPTTFTISLSHGTAASTLTVPSQVACKVQLDPVNASTWKADCHPIQTAVALASLATQAANTVVANVSGSTAAPTAAAIPTGIQNYVAGTGYNQATSHQVTGALNCADSSGSGTTQFCTTAPSFTPAANDCIVYTTTTANTGTGLTLNVNALGAKSVAKWQGTTTLAANDVLANKQVLTCYDGTNWELGWIGNAPSGGSSAWSSLTNAAANLSLTNSGFNSTFTQNGTDTWTWQNTTAATVTTPQNSPTLAIAGTAWVGAGASGADGWTLQDVPTAGLNQASTLTFAHTGTSTGRELIGFPGGSTIRVDGGIFAAFAASGQNLTLGSGSNNVIVAINNSNAETVTLGDNSSGTSMLFNLQTTTPGQKNVIATQLKATAALTSGQVIKIDSANASSVVVAATTDTAAGAVLGFVENSPGAGAAAFIAVPGSIITDPLLGTGTCSIGNFVIVDTTTAGRVKCTGTYTDGTILGRAITSQSTVGSAVSVYVQPL